MQAHGDTKKSVSSFFFFSLSFVSVLNQDKESKKKQQPDFINV